MASKKSIQIYHALFDNTYNNTKKSIPDLLKEFGSSAFGAWLDSHEKKITNDSFPQLNSDGLIHLLKISNLHKDYSAKDLTKIHETLKPYRREINIGDVVIGGTYHDPYHVGISEIKKITPNKVYLQYWSIPKNTHERIKIPGDKISTIHRVFIEYSSDRGYSLITNHYLIKEIKASNGLAPDTLLVKRLKDLEKRYS